MNSIARVVGAIAIVVTLQFHPQETWAQDSQTKGTQAQNARELGFTGKHFVQWSKDAQNSFIQTSITMAGVVATQVKPPIARCVDTWYFGNADNKTGANNLIRATIRKYPDGHPSGVILAIIQRECGQFK